TASRVQDPSRDPPPRQGSPAGGSLVRESTAMMNDHTGRRPRPSERGRVGASAALLLALAAAALATVPGRLQASAPAAPHSVLFPTMKLRAYGALGGTCSSAEAGGQPAAALQIACE